MRIDVALWIWFDIITSAPYGGVKKPIHKRQILELCFIRRTKDKQLRYTAGWIISIIFGTVGMAIPSSQETTLVTPVAKSRAEIQTILAKERPEINWSTEALELKKIAAVLLAKYTFGEQGERVSTLQGALKTVRIDGVYGTITRREHMKKLNSLNLPTHNVPQIPVINSSGENDGAWNIPSDPEERCPMWEQLFQDVGLEPVEVFSYVAWRESRCNADSQNARWDAKGNMTYALNRDKSYDTGLLQINSSWRSRVSEVCGPKAIENRMSGLKDVNCNVKFAKWLMDNSKGKLGNWRVYKK